MIQVTTQAQQEIAAFFEGNVDKARTIRVYLHEGG